MEKFIQRGNIALFKKRLAETLDEAERAVILKLLAAVEAKDIPPKERLATPRGYANLFGMPNSTFRCPYTGMSISRPFAIDPAADPAIYESVQCPACGRLHLINKSTGQLLGEGNEENRSRP